MSDFWAFCPEVPDCLLLPRCVGLSRSFEMMLTGRMVDALEAQRIGLVSASVPDAELLPPER